VIAVVAILRVVAVLNALIVLVTTHNVITLHLDAVPRVDTTFLVDIVLIDITHVLTAQLVEAHLVTVVMLSHQEKEFVIIMLLDVTIPLVRTLIPTLPVYHQSAQVLNLLLNLLMMFAILMFVLVVIIIARMETMPILETIISYLYNGEKNHLGQSIHDD